MIIISPESFSPSDTMMRIAYSKMISYLSPEAANNLILSAKEQIKYRFLTSLDAIRDWKCYSMDGEYFPIVENYSISLKFINEVAKKSDFYKTCEMENESFRLRFGEELLNWGLRQPSQLKILNLEIDNGNMFLIRNEEEYLQVIGLS